MAKRIFQIQTMHCTSCAMLLEGIADELEGVTQVTASYRRQQIEVEYDDSQVTDTQIIAAVKQHGYDAILIGC
jgi:copper chaperone CopZ